MSWFDSTGLNATFNSLTESVAKATESVKDAIPEEYKEGLAKLTLNTEEMINERQHFREEAQRKEAAKKRLDSILPWDTMDSEREILVDECKDAILALSQREETFFGPYEMPFLNVQLEDDNDDDDDEEEMGEVVDIEEADKMSGSRDGGDGGAPSDLVAEAPTDEEPYEKPAPKPRHMKPSEESKEKLSKLQPLPPLLEEFDLDSHVGLIQKVLKEDPMLIKMQASLSGGGAREKIFWKNYFFHCAFTRYEAGLSIDEIWSYQVQSSETEPTPKDGGNDDAAAPSAREEETVVFDAEADPSSAAGSRAEPPHAGFQDVEKVMAADNVDTAGEAVGTDASLEHSEGSPNNGFEMVDDSVDVAGDPEMDELEAEIARELED